MENDAAERFETALETWEQADVELSGAAQAFISATNDGRGGVAATRVLVLLQQHLAWGRYHMPAELQRVVLCLPGFSRRRRAPRQNA